ASSIGKTKTTVVIFFIKEMKRTKVVHSAYRRYKAMKLAERPGFLSFLQIERKLINFVLRARAVL
ncbi:MAG TPA: hypothetical protein PLV51_12960, partial [Lentimicrobium sp.]|nr:hypothetical protein [Lentimicrobium sp.]